MFEKRINELSKENHDLYVQSHTHTLFISFPSLKQAAFTRERDERERLELNFNICEGIDRLDNLLSCASSKALIQRKSLKKSKREQAP